MEFLLGLLSGVVIGVLLRWDSDRTKVHAGDDVADVAQGGDVIDSKVRYTSYKSEPKSPAISWKASLHEVDAVGMLLYLGAFLLVAGAGLFVGLSHYGGATKVVVISATALIFYGAGMVLYRFVSRLRPAGVALTAIGLVCLPLTGAAVNFYLTNGSNGSTVWFVTSALSLVLYVLALWQIRQELMGYMSVLMCLSLWLSTVAIINAPIHYFGWAMILLGIAYLLATRSKKVWREIATPLSVSAMIMVPAALIITSVSAGSSIGSVDQGITGLLAAVFYAVAAWQEHSERARKVYFVLSYLLIPYGILRICMQLLDGAIGLSFVLNAVSMAQLVFVSRWRKDRPDWIKVALIISAVFVVGSSVSAMPIFDNKLHMYALLIAVNTALLIAVGLWLRSTAYVGWGLLGLITLPALVGYGVFRLASPAVGVAVGYLALTVMLMLSHRYALLRNHVILIRVAYIASLLVAVGIGLSCSNWQPVVVSAIAGLICILIAYYERWSYAICASAVMCVMAIVFALHWALGAWPFGVHQWPLANCLGALGLVYYLVGVALRRSRIQRDYGGVWLLSGLSILYLAAFAEMLGKVGWPTIGCLALAGALTAYEAYRLRNRAVICAGLAVVLAAIQMSMYKLGMHEAYIYWYMWAGYCVAAGYYCRGRWPIAASILPAAIGVSAQLAQSSNYSFANTEIAWLALSLGYYMVGKVHLIAKSKKHDSLAHIGRAWQYTGLICIYLISLLWWWHVQYGENATVGALALVLAGLLSCYEAYLYRSRPGEYLAIAVSLIGVQWFMCGQHIYQIQIYTHMWAMYFAVLAWLAHRDGLGHELRVFTWLALLFQTVPLALLALAGDTSIGQMLLFESIVVMLFGVAAKYSLVSWWGLVAAVGAVLYQLREYQFFVLVLLGAIVICVGVVKLIRQEKK